MANYVELSRVGVEVEDGLPGDIPPGCFKTIGKIWRPLEPHGARIDDLKYLINLCETKKTRFRVTVATIDLEKSKSSNYLVIGYENPSSDVSPSTSEGKEAVFLVQFLVLLFKGYRRELDVHTITMMYSFLACFGPGKKIWENTQELSINNLAKRFYDVLNDQHEHSMKNEVGELAPLLLQPRFLPQLCRYQERTVRWLLKREKETLRFHAHYLQLTSVVDGSFRYKHQLSARLESEEPQVTEIAPGGILADEMGLGKTVEILALILLHRRENTIPFVPSAPSVAHEELPAKKKKPSPVVFCICISKSAKDLVQCSSCSLWQHTGCVERYNGDHDDSINKPYICPSCWNDLSGTTLLPTAATFIVTPNTIRSQWLAEIRRHTEPPLRTLVYEGVNNWISPRQLAAYDVVLTDYTVLRGEINHTSAQNSERTMRRPPRSMRTYTPLLMLEWWRVCLDEAQIVESNTSKVATLVRLLPAINRWAVTGTPIQRSLDDLRPLLTFIGLQSVCEPPQVWDSLVENFNQLPDAQCGVSFYALTELMHRCMWRSCKSRVAEELPIPPQTELVHYVDQSNLEKLFYSEQHAECSAIFAESVERYIERAGGTVHISPNVMNNLMAPLSKIRQCCTVSVVKTGSKWNNVGLSHKQFLQPKELHTHLKAINESECKTELRTMASSYNGMAGIYFLQGNYRESVRQYQLVLELATEYKDFNLTVDSLLQIHALHNIVEAYETMPAVDREDLPDGKLQAYKDSCSALEWKFLEPYAANLAKVQSAFEASASEYEHICERTSEEFLVVVSKIVRNLSESGSHTTYLQRISDTLVEHFPSNEVVRMIQAFAPVTFVISSWYKNVKDSQAKLSKAFDKLQFFSGNIRPEAQMDPRYWAKMEKFINSVYDCHLKTLRENGRKTPKTTSEDNSKVKSKLCDLCIVKDMLNNFECLLFNKAIAKHTQQAEGFENPSMQLLLLKLIFNSTKWILANNSYASEASKHLKSFECIQNMSKRWMALWIEIEFAVKAYDELDMCKMRLSLRTDSDNENDDCIYRVDPFEMEIVLLEQITHRQDAEREFIAKLARLKYIVHLEADNNTEPCPICRCDEELRYAVLECGHYICLQCLKQMRRLGTKQQIACAICRHEQCPAKFFYVTRTSNQLREIEGIEISGNYSAKIMYIVRLILKQKFECEQSANKDEPKILIFSQWQDILATIADALAKNGIRYLLRSTPRDIANFKNLELGITCLLMPISKGAKGLNLIEATHVFLVEPLLNPGDDKQAIGRVHRFGQTKPTTVHRFIVRGTIEENIYNILVASDATNLSLNNTKSLDCLRNLFQLQDEIAEVEEIEFPQNFEV